MAKQDDSTKIKELLEIIKHKVDSMSFIQTGQSASTSLMKDQMSVMNKKLDGITERLDDPNTGLERINKRLDAIWEQTTDLTEHGFLTEDNIKKLGKRVVRIEKDSGVEVPPELQLADVA